MNFKLKTFIVLFIILKASSTFGQLSLAQQDSVAKSLSPITDKAIVYVIRPTAYGFAIRMDVNCDTTYIGTTGAKSYIYTVLPPGKYTFLSRSENKSYLGVTLEAGKLYYIEQQVKMGMIYARTKINLVDEEKGKNFLAKCKLDHTNKYSQ